MGEPGDQTTCNEVVPAEAAGSGEDESTGLPLLRTWRGVYGFVIGAFVLWVGLLFALGSIFK
jgi:hypothetical protein